LYTQQTFLAPKVKEVLDYLIKSYELGVISNGFATIQRTKIKNLGLESYFKYQIYSSQVGVMKPRPEIFLEAMREAQKAAHEICFVGDSYEYDILGAKRVGWKAILYAPDGQIGTGELADAVINDLGQLKEIF
ncbi:MAG: HAD family hydrolase, partial [Calditrichaeota bacterium]